MRVELGRLGQRYAQHLSARARLIKKMEGTAERRPSEVCSCIHTGLPHRIVQFWSEDVRALPAVRGAIAAERHVPALLAAARDALGPDAAGADLHPDVRTLRGRRPGDGVPRPSLRVVVDPPPAILAVGRELPPVHRATPRRLLPGEQARHVEPLARRGPKLDLTPS